jgi:type IV pilus assembly protein PilB
MARKRLGELLVMAGVIDEFQLQSALGEQRRWGRPLGVTLVEMGLVDETTLVKLLSTQLNLPAIDLDRTDVDEAALGMLDYDLCSQYQCVPFRYEERGKFLHVAMADPTNLEVFDRIRVHTQCNLRPHLAGPKSIEDTIRRRYLGQSQNRSIGGYGPAASNDYVQRSGEQVFDQLVDVGASPPAGRPAGRPVQPRPQSSGSHPAVSAQRSAQQVSTARFDEQLMQDVMRELKEVKAMLHRDEMVLRKLMSLIVQKGVCTREELVARLQED